MRIERQFQYNREQMRTAFLALIIGTFAFAQAPAVSPAKPAPAKPAPAKPGAGKTGTAKAPAKTGLTPAQSAKLMNPSSLKATAPPEYKVRFTTLKDTSFVVDVHRDWAPNGADRFYNLVKSGFFVGVRFYRISPGFVVQFGVSPDPKVSLAWAPARIPDDPVKEKNTKGRLTFAMGGPNTRTTQLFFNLKDNSMLDGMGFAPIGEVIEGMDVVEGLFNGYGEIQEQGGHGPSQMKLMAEGEKYLKANFDNLDTIKSTVVIWPEAPAPAKPSAGKKAAPAKPAPAKATPTKPTSDKD
jgi:peptidyl-prolyl cis-trans isomerase A (cyclophilin A)